MAEKPKVIEKPDVLEQPDILKPLPGAGAAGYLPRRSRGAGKSAADSRRRPAGFAG